MAQADVQKPTKANETDVISLLKSDHQKVKDLFSEFEGLQNKQNGEQKKAKIVKQICQELTLHALAEEAIVYPAAREVIKDEELMDEADVEHAGAKELIAQLQTMSPGESHYDAKVTVLREYIEHHVKEEEDKMFPKLQKSGADRKAMGEEVIHFKEEHEEEIKSDADHRDKAGSRSHKGKSDQSGSGSHLTRGGTSEHHAKAGNQGPKNK